MFVSEQAEQRERAVGRLEAEMAELAGVINAAHGRMAELVAQALDEGLWDQAGIHSPEHWLAWQLGLSAHAARQLVAVARRHGELPCAAAALSAGELSIDQAAVVARRCPADHDASVTDLAKLTTVNQLSHTLRRYAFDDPSAADGEPGVAAEPERREVSFGSTEDGRWRLHADLPGDEGLLVETALNAAHHDLVDQANRDGNDRPAVTWADTLLAVAEQSLAAGAATHPGTDRYVVLAHLEAETDRGVDAGRRPDRPGVLSGHLGPPLPAALRRLVTCDATIRAVHEEGGTPVSVGRSQRIVPDRTRRLIEHRDHGCRVPGCPAKRFLHIHHIVHWEDGGATSTDNLIALCRKHHRQHHHGVLAIEGHADPPDGVTFAANGRTLPPAGRPRPPAGSPGPAAAALGIPTQPYDHPLGERLHQKWVHLPADRPANGS